MNKKTIAEQAIRILAGGEATTESEIKPQEVRVTAGQVIDQLVLEHLIGLNKLEGNVNFRVPSDFTLSANVTLTNKSGTLPFYLKLPQLRGIQEVTIGSGESLGYLYPMQGRGGLLDDLESSSLEGNDGYRITGDKIKIISDGVFASCTVYYVPSASKASDTLDLPFPDYIYEDVIKRIVKQFVPHIQISEDQAIDNKQS